jgi:hypothetical protein
LYFDISLQQWKLKISNSVVNLENATMKTMKTDQVLDLFEGSKSPSTSSAGTPAGGEVDITGQIQMRGKKSGLSDMMESLSELWSEAEYDDEFDFNKYLQQTKK